MMRITIEVDRNADWGNAPVMPAPGQAAKPAVMFEVPDDDGSHSGAAGTLHPSGALDAGAAADQAPQAEQDVPADLLARAAALNALSAGRAPDLSAHAGPDAVSTHEAPGTTGSPTDAPDLFACGITAGEFDGTTNAGGPASGSGVDEDATTRFP